MWKGVREALEAEAAEAKAETDYTVPSPDRDFALVVEGRRLYVNAEFLATQSPVLRQMLTGPWKEAEQREAELADQDYEEILELIRCLCFAPYRAEVTAENVSLLLAFAAQLLMPELDRRCAQFLRSALDNSPPPETLVLIMDLAMKYGMEALVMDTFPQLARQPLLKLKELSESGAMPANVAAAVWQAKATKLSKAELITDPHQYGQKPYRRWGATRRVCYHCRRVHSTVEMDRCKLCGHDFCRSCKNFPFCSKNSVAHCAECAKPVSAGEQWRNPPPFKAETVDGCTCWLNDPLLVFLNPSSSSAPSEPPTPSS